jgi:hypothetical protein
MRGSVYRHEQLAVRALEAAVALGLPRDQLGGEGLLAMRADDFSEAVCGGDVGHLSKVPGNLCPGPFEPLTALGQT